MGFGIENDPLAAGLEDAGGGCGRPGAWPGKSGFRADVTAGSGEEGLGLRDTECRMQRNGRGTLQNEARPPGVQQERSKRRGSWDVGWACASCTGLMDGGWAARGQGSSLVGRGGRPRGSRGLLQHG